MADFPTYLNKCLVDSYSYKDSSNEVVSTGMESGNNRLRQRSKKIPSVFSVSFIFTQDQLSVFEYFNQNVLLSRTQRFNIYLKTGATQQLFDVKYFAVPQISVIGTQKYKVDCQFESSNRQMISPTPLTWFAFDEDTDALGDGFDSEYDIEIGGNFTY